MLLGIFSTKSITKNIYCGKDFLYNEIAFFLIVTIVYYVVYIFFIYICITVQ